MAYKFQLGDSVLSGAVEQEGNIVASDGFISDRDWETLIFLGVPQSEEK